MIQGLKRKKKKKKREREKVLPNVEDRTLTVLYFDLRGRVEYEGLAGFFFPTNVSAFGPPVGYRLATMYLHMKMLGIGLYISMEMAGLVNRWYLWRHQEIKCWVHT